MAKINFGQTRPSNMSGSYTFQLYQNAQLNQDTKALFIWSKKEAFPKNWISKFQFSEREKNMNSLESKLQ